MDSRRCYALAQELLDARRTVSTIAPPSGRDDARMSQEDAYIVAAMLDHEWTQAEHRSNGVKIGLTDAAKWPALGVSAPMWGRTYVDTTHDSAENPVDIRSCVAARVEAEVIVGLSRPLEPGATAPEVAQAIDWAALGFELVDSHVADWNVTPTDLIADFGAHAGLVIGPRRRLTQSELLELGNVTIELTNGVGSPIPGAGARVLGGPIPAIVAVLAATEAPVLGAGSVVSTGALTGGAHGIAPGQRWRLEPAAGPLAGVELILAGSES